MADGVARKKGKSGNRKHGRNKAGCTRYMNMQTRERNKARRLSKHLAVHPEDASALVAFASMPEAFRKAARKKTLDHGKNV